jgi:flavin reductase (DIM6/NTAB) family NADH-FMN oxidoreductase RutF
MKKIMRGSPALVPCPAVLLSVAGPEHPNIITLSWVANVCSDPPSVAVGIRSQRFSHKLVKDAGDFVLNVPTTDLLEATKFCGSKSGKNLDKFKGSNLTALPANKVKSPLIKECPINLECKTSKIVNVGVHDLFIAEIVEVHMDDDVLDEKGRPNISKMKLFTYQPITAEYWSLGDVIS